MLRRKKKNGFGDDVPPDGTTPAATAPELTIVGHPTEFKDRKFERSQGAHQQYDDVSGLTPPAQQTTVQIVNPQSQQIVDTTGTTQTNTVIDQIWFQLNLARNANSIKMTNLGTTPVIFTWNSDSVYIEIINDDPSNSIYVAFNAVTVAPTISAAGVIQAAHEIRPREVRPFPIHATSLAIVGAANNMTFRGSIGIQQQTPQ
jgi:hypothetical protein